MCFALEALLTDKDQHPLERGLSYQLREFGAFLASDDYEERIAIQKEIKKLYSIRCTIVHQGVAPNLSEDAYYKLLNIIKSIIAKLFFLLENKNIDNFIKLKNHIDKIKFS